MITNVAEWGASSNMEDLKNTDRLGDNRVASGSNKEDKRKNMREALKYLTFLSQFGLSLVVPILICLFLCYWLTTRFGFGGWIYIPGFIFGLGSSCMTAWKFYVSVNEKNKKEKKKQPPSFNRHF